MNNEQFKEGSSCPLFLRNNESSNTWKKIQERAEYLRTEAEAIHEITEEEKEKILKNRAEKLSHVKENVKDLENLIMIISFYIAEELYGIDVKYLKEVFETTKITKIPCTPKLYSGVINFRGKVLTIINLKILFNLPEKNISSSNISNNLSKHTTNHNEKTNYKILIIDYDGITAGIIADNISKLLTIPTNSIKDVSSFFTEKNKIVKSEVYVGNTPLLIIDPHTLLNDKRLIVNEDI